MIPFGRVDISALAAWLSNIPFEDWPQQSHTELRPAMVTDPEWHGFGGMTAPAAAEIMARFPPEMRSFQHMLSAVMPGHEIEEHRDQQAPYWLHRVHVPIISNDNAVFISDGAARHLKTGFCYLVDTRKEHAVRNDGATPRVHFMFDVRR